MRLEIQTTEVLETTWGGTQIKSLPIAERFQGYCDSINWRKREGVARNLPAFEKIIAAVRGHFDPMFFNDIVSHLERDGLKINSAGRICKAQPS